MRVCGIIAEYDPFHRGHLHQMQKAREESGADFVLCVLGCAFSQRGEPMLFSTSDRARMALTNGADLVLGLPFSFSCAQANRFAAGGVGILSGLQAVTHISFGAESVDLARLRAAASLLVNPDEGFSKLVSLELAKGASLARAQGLALSAAFQDNDPAFWAQPNVILGIAYLMELSRRQSSITPLPVLRQGGYHDRQVGAFSSASAVREALLFGNWKAVKQALPEASYAIVREAALAGRLHKPQALGSALLSQLLFLREEKRLLSPEVSEGLDLRILKMLPKAACVEDLKRLVKTKRYPMARINRALCHALVRASSFPKEPAYARLLGFNKRALPLLTRIKEGGFPLIDKPARQNGVDIAQDLRSEELWALGAGQSPDSAWQQKIITIQ